MILTKAHAQAYGMLRMRMDGVDIHALVNAHAGIKCQDTGNALALLKARMKNRGEALIATLPSDWDKHYCRKRYFAFRRWNAALIRARQRG